MTKNLAGLFQSNDIFKAHVTGVNIDADTVASIKTPAKLEQLILKQYQLKPGNLLIIEWKNLEDEIVVTSDRTILISEKVGEYLKTNF
jgi:hypothetical protein